MMKLLYALFAVAGLAFSANGQCQNGQCYPSQSGSVVSVKETKLAHGWYASEKCSKCIDLYWNGELVGTLDPVRSMWQTNGKTHSVDLVNTFGFKANQISYVVPKPKDPPLPKECICEVDGCKCKKCPEDCVAISQVVFKSADCGCQDCKCDVCKCGEMKEPAKQLNGPVSNFGICKEWIPAKRETYRLNGAEVNKNQAFGVMASGVPDDGKFQRVVIISESADERRQVLDDFDNSPELKAFRGKLVVQAYSPDHWHVKDVGFVKTGKPTIYIQSSTGKVLHRQDDYVGGAARLAGALRKADPSYEPSKDPDLSKTPAPVPNPDKPKIDPVAPDQSFPLKTVFGLLALVAAVVGAAFLFFKK